MIPVVLVGAAGVGSVAGVAGTGAGVAGSAGTAGSAGVPGAAFGVAFISGQALAFLIAFFIGSALSENGHHTATAYLQLGAGVAVLALTAWNRHPKWSPSPEESRSA